MKTLCRNSIIYESVFLPGRKEVMCPYNRLVKIINLHKKAKKVGDVFYIRVYGRILFLLEILRYPFSTFALNLHPF